MDTEDGDLTHAIVVGGDTVDFRAIGTYVITYNVSDSSGNAAAEVRWTVIVEPGPQPPPRKSGGGSLGLLELMLLLCVVLVARPARKFRN